MAKRKRNQAKVQKTAKMSPSARERATEMPAAMPVDETARNRASQRRSDDIESGRPMRGGRPEKHHGHRRGTPVG